MQKLKNSLAGFIIFTAVLPSLACLNGSNQQQPPKTETSPTAEQTKPATRGCPSGTKPCGDACIPDNQICDE